MRTFRSDNYSGVHPDIMAALLHCNTDHAASYGEDDHTRAAIARLEDIFGVPCRVAFVMNGTGANILALRTALRPYQSVICSEWAHITTNETGAVESLVGAKTLLVPSNDGKIYPADILERYRKETLNEIHATQPKVLSIAQCTEYGTVYSVQELSELRSLCDELGLYLHIDGCRVYNAAASLGCAIADITTGVKADILSLGGTKNGAMMAEAVVVFNPALWEGLPYLQKNTTQLYSKNRYAAVQFSALFENDLWLRNASHANEMARILSGRLAKLPGVSLSKPVHANHIFINLPLPVAKHLESLGWCYVWNSTPAEIRLVCSFDTTEEDMDNFIDDLLRALADKSV